MDHAGETCTSITFRIHRAWGEVQGQVWIEDYVDIRISEDRLNMAIYKALISKNITMPAPERVIYFTSPEDSRSVPRKE